MKIRKIIPYEDEFSEACIIFDNGKVLDTSHPQECCEKVYAAVEEIDDLAYTYEFEEPLTFESVEGFGFRFGNPGQMVSVPCYDIQEGCYNGDLYVFYEMEDVLMSSSKHDY